MDDEETFEARFIHPTGHVVQRFYGTHDALLADAARYAPTHNCYFGVTTRVGQHGKAEWAGRAASCWADIDWKLWAGAADSKTAALSRIEAFPLPATAVVNSGGGLQPYWRLAEPLDVRLADNRRRLEAVNSALARAVCGPAITPDHVHDVARVLRIPGTVNHKYQPTRRVAALWCEPETNYALGELEAAVQERWPWAWRINQVERLPRAIWAQSTEPRGGLLERARRGRIRGTTLALLDSTGPEGYQSASEADQAIAAGLISAGLNQSEVLQLLIHSARGLDADRRKGARHAEDYWRRTVASAAAFVRATAAGGRRTRTIRIAL